MFTIKAPAGSANLGPGFDTLGIGLDLYNTFTAAPALETKLYGVEERFDNQDNLFLKAYRAGCEALSLPEIPVHVHFSCDIPVSRGLGSSTSLLIAGLKAASLLHENKLSDECIFQIAAKEEGHGDNVAPCLFGGLCISGKDRNNRFVHTKLPVSDAWLFTVMIPDFEVSTEEARKILPETYARETVVHNTSNALFLANALASGNLKQLLDHCTDEVHEPYRSQLIPDFTFLKETLLEEEAAFMISGSGSTCLAIHQKPLSSSLKEHIAEKTSSKWTLKEVHIAEKGTLTW